MSAAPSDKRSPKKLALLVGSNPLPNYLAAMVLKPREVILIYSPETRDPKENLREALTANDRGVAVSEVCIGDATNVRKIKDACRNLDVDHLHYSGGTKPMAAHARQAFQLSEWQASYLDERKGLLRFDDGYDLRLDEHDVGLTLDVVLRLHGIERRSAGENAPGGPTDGDVTALAQYVLRQPDAADTLRETLRPDGQRRSITQAKSAPWIPPSDLSLSASRVPEENWTNARYEPWDEFLCGGWLERWTAAHVRACTDGALDLVEVAVHCKRARPSQIEFEIDIAVLRGHRLYVVSCTTDRKKALCKSKLFEVAMRARQMGGDLARSALVCLLDGSDAKGPYVEQLRADIASVWDAPNVPRVFGLADLREWAGGEGAPDRTSLKGWLDS